MLHIYSEYKLSSIAGKPPFYQILYRVIIWSLLLIFSVLLAFPTFASKPLEDDEDLNKNGMASQKNTGAIFSNTGNICITHSKFTGQENIYNYYQCANDISNMDSICGFSAREKKSNEFQDRYSKMDNVPKLTINFQPRVKINMLNLYQMIGISERDDVIVVFFVGLQDSEKTDLAKHYAHTHREEYSFIRIFNAENQEKLQESFELLAKNTDENFNLAGISNAYIRKVYTTEFILKNIKKIQQRWLWIFDNVEEYQTIVDYIPNIPGIRGTIIVTLKLEHLIDIKDLVKLQKNGVADRESVEKTVKLITEKLEIITKPQSFRTFMVLLSFVA